MKREAFLKEIQNYSQLCLVGPFFHNPTDYDISNIPSIFVDGGNCFENEFTSELKLSLGDGDSACSTPDIELPSEKNYSDLKYALSLVPTNIEEIYLMGFSGGRFDHWLINYGECYYFLKNSGGSITLHIDGMASGHKDGRHCFQFKGTFSILLFEPTNLTVSGNCQYPLENQEVLPFSSHTLSNISHGDFVVLADKPFFIYHSGEE